MPKNLILFCEIWVLTPSFFGTSLRSHYPIFSPQIKQENWLTYCSMRIQNYLCDKLGIQFLDFFMSQYPLLFVDSILFISAAIVIFEQATQAPTRENLSSGSPTKRVSNQSLRLNRLGRELILDMILLKKQKTKLLMRLRGCTG